MRSPEELTALLNEDIDRLNASVDAAVAHREDLRQRLALITKAALERIDGDSGQDTAWSEIIGIAEGDPNWLQHAKQNYDLKHEALVQLAATLLLGVIESGEDLASQASIQRAASAMADQIEQSILPAMELAEDGRRFRASQRLDPFMPHLGVASPTEK